MSCHTKRRTPPECTPRYAKLQSTGTWNSDTCAYVSRPLTSRGTQALFVVNSVKLHLTAFKNKAEAEISKRIDIILSVEKSANTIQFYIFNLTA